MPVLSNALVIDKKYNNAEIRTLTRHIGARVKGHYFYNAKSFASFQARMLLMNFRQLFAVHARK